LGKTLEEVNRLGGDNTVNLLLLEEAETLQKAGIDLNALSLNYQFNEADFAVLGEFLSTCHCLVAGWIADLHHLFYRDSSPQLSQWLPQLFPDGIESTTLQSLLHSILTVSHKILGEYQKPNLSYQIPLKLAQNLISLSAPSLGRQQIAYSLQLWLQNHQLSRLEEIQELAPRLSPEDLNYLETLRKCLLPLGDETEVAYIDRCLQLKSPSIGGTAQFVLCHTWPSFAGKVTSLAIAINGRKLVSSGGSSLELWELEQGKGELSPPQKLSGFQGKISTLAISPDGNFLVGSERTNQRSYLKIWNLQKGKLEHTLLGHRQPISALAVGPWKKDGGSYFIASGCQKIKLWDVHSGKSLQTLFGHRLRVRAIAISPDGAILLSGSEDKSIRLWNPRTGELIRTLLGHQGGIRTIAFTPDGQCCVSGSEDQTLRLWDLKSGKLINTLIGHTGAVRAIAISPDGQLIVSGAEDKTIKVWDRLTGKRLETLTGHRAAVCALTISPDGETLASGCEDKTIKTWQMQRRETEHPLCVVL
jgi:WD40 repeat protein